MNCAGTIAGMIRWSLSAWREAGFQQINLAQRGEMPDDWKPMPTIGSGVQEIRIRDTSGAFRSN